MGVGAANRGSLGSGAPEAFLQRSTMLGLGVA